MLLNVCFGQNFQTKKLTIVRTGVPTKLDSFTVYPNSIQIIGDSTASFQYDSQKNTITVRSKRDSVRVKYQVFPFNLSKQYYNRDIRFLDTINYAFSDLTYFKKKMYKSEDQREELFTTENFNKNGNISRGISFGNTQSVFVNSSLNLQMEGNITPDLKLTAVISDQNIPVQPNGNTQNIQQFDRVYIQFEREKGGKLTAGDLVMKNKQGYFLKYLKNVQGVQGELEYQIGKDSKAFTLAGISFAKGKFTSLQLNGTGFDNSQSAILREGVAGPYRLSGANNERFITVIANSEKVYLDGNLLKRGFNYDYVIDYNTAEITFTANIIITKFSRVRVDFEYTERNYARSNYQIHHQQTYKRFEATLNYYSEQDNPSNPLSISLSDNDKRRLSLIGDTLAKAIVPSGDSVGFSASSILYRLLKDTLVNAINYKNIYIYSTNEQNAFYQVSFSQVGLGNGDYVQVITSTNGRVYQWVAPVNGQKQGSYQPSRIMATPKKLAMTTIGLKYKISNKEEIYTESAFSQNDLNLYSPIDNGDNQGRAFKFGYIGQDKTVIKGLKWFGNVDYEYLDKNFSPVDRFRAVDFDRDWNASNTTVNNFSAQLSQLKAIDQIATAQLGIKNKGGLVSYKIIKRQKGNDVNGIQHLVEMDQKINRWHFIGDLYKMNNENKLTDAQWLRYNLGVSYGSKWMVPGYQYSVDKNRVLALGRDSIISSAMYFEQHKLFVKNSDTSRSKFKLEHLIRQDNVPILGALPVATQSNTSTFNISKKINKTNDIILTTTYRKLVNKTKTDSRIPTLEETVMGRLDLNSFWWKKNVKSELTMASTTGRELRKEYVYLAVATGQGNYTWRDDNKDGIQQLNEFYEAINPDEKNYLKTFVPTDQYISAFTNNFNYRLNVVMPKEWKNSKVRTLKFLSKLSNNTQYTVDKKVTENAFLYRFVPFLNDIPDSVLLSNQSVVRSTFFFNRTSPVFGAEYSYQDITNKQLLTNGFETKNNRFMQFNIRTNIGKWFNFRVLSESGQRINASDFLENRNFKVQYYRLRPELAFQPNDQLRFTSTYLITTKQNLQNSNNQERALINEWMAEARINKAGSRSITANIKLIEIEYSGEINTPIGYEMLEALRPGSNYTWTLNWQQKLANGLQMTMSYDGRQSPQSPIIHIGRMQVSALF